MSSVKPAISALGFDWGTKTIGVAVGQSVTNSASILPAIPAKDGIPQWPMIEALLKAHKPDIVVVGLPLNMDGSESDISARAKKFAQRIHGRFNATVELQDERLSTFEAKGEILRRKKTDRFKDNAVDSISAQLILESWFRLQYCRKHSLYKYSMSIT